MTKHVLTILIESDEQEDAEAAIDMFLALFEDWWGDLLWAAGNGGANGLLLTRFRSGGLL